MEAERTESGAGPMVSVRNAFKSYGKHQVLRDFNLTVLRGSIYAFLGPSGCGKTTLLTCLVGRKQLDSGEISLGISYKQQLGYMPQETALVRDISIKEILYFFGKLFGITSDKLEARKKELFKFLDLPPETQVIGTLSGGQQRRVSLCIALLHDPQLLILDEPTVGLDPLLSHSLWQYFRELAGSGQKTIVVTTHYIEEARNADMVGMMREGVLVAEGSPNALMAEHGTDQLEQVFLSLSQLQHLHKEEENIRAPARVHYQKPLLVEDNRFSVNRLQAQIWKSIFWILRNNVILGLLLILPVIQCSIFSFAVGRHPQGLSVGVIDDELPAGWTPENVNPSPFNCTSPSLTSRRYIHRLGRKNLNLVNFLDKESAEEATRRGDVWGYLHISGNYTDSLFTRMEMEFSTPDDVVEGSLVSVVIDMSNQFISSFIKVIVASTYKEYMEELYEYCNWPKKAAWLPNGDLVAVYGSLFPVFTDFSLPSAITLFAFFLPPVYICGSILMEKRDGLQERSIISGLTMVEYLTGSGLLCSALLILQISLMIWTVYGILDHMIIGSIFSIFLINYLTGLCGLFYGFLLAVTCESDLTATSIGFGCCFSFTFLCGLVWPMEAMHYLLRAVGDFFPLTQCTEAVRSIALRGHGMSHPSVYPAFFSLTGWMVVFSVATYLCIRFQAMAKRLSS